MLIQLRTPSPSPQFSYRASAGFMDILKCPAHRCLQNVCAKDLLRIVGRSHGLPIYSRPIQTTWNTLGNKWQHRKNCGPWSVDHEPCSMDSFPPTHHPSSPQAKTKPVRPGTPQLSPSVGREEGSSGGSFGSTFRASPPRKQLWGQQRAIGPKGQRGHRGPQGPIGP